MTRGYLVVAFTLLFTTGPYASQEEPNKQKICAVTAETYQKISRVNEKSKIDLGRLPVFKLADTLKPIKSSDSEKLHQKLFPDIKLLIEHVLEAQNQLAVALFSLTQEPGHLKALNQPYDVLIGHTRVTASDLPETFLFLLQSSGPNAQKVINRTRFGLFRKLFIFQLLMKQLERSTTFPDYARRALKSEVKSEYDLEESYSLAFAEYVVCYGDLLFQHLLKQKGESFVGQYSPYEDADPPIKLINRTLMQETDGLPFHIRFLWLSALLMQYTTDSKFSFEACVDERLEERCYRFPPEKKLPPMILSVKAHLLLPVELLPKLQQELRATKIEEIAKTKELESLTASIAQLKAHNLKLMTALISSKKVPDNLQTTIDEHQRQASELAKQTGHLQGKLAQITATIKLLSEQFSKDQSRLRDIKMAEEKELRKQKLLAMVTDAQATIEGLIEIGAQLQDEMTQGEHALGISLSEHREKLQHMQDQAVSTEKEIKERQDQVRQLRSKNRQQTEALEAIKKAQKDALCEQQSFLDEEAAADEEIRKLEAELSATNDSNAEIIKSLQSAEIEGSELQKTIQGLEARLKPEDQKAIELTAQLSCLQSGLSEVALTFARDKAICDYVKAQADCIRQGVVAAEARLMLAKDFREKILSTPMLFISQITYPGELRPGITIWCRLDYLFKLVQDHLLTLKSPNNSNE